MEQDPNDKTNSGSSVATPSYNTDPSGNGIPTAIGDCGENSRPRGSNLPKLQEPRDFEICSSFKQDVCGGSRATQPTSSVDSFENGEIDVQQCKGCSNKDHQCYLENGHINNAAGKLFSDLPEVQGQCDSRIGLISNQESCVGGLDDKHTCVGDGRENRAMAAGKTLLPLNPQRIPLKKFGVNRRDPFLLLPNLSKVEKVVFILDMVRRREFFEYNTRIRLTLPTRFCEYNIAFFDLDKESDFKREPQFSKIPDSYWCLDTSMNIISIKVSESDVPYPINIYGTVVARDQVDYRCVYLFKRDRDNPQCITSVDDALTLTGPYRALAGDVMFFEFNLKIIMGDEEAFDQEFSKGLLDRRTVSRESVLMTTSISSCLSEVKMEFNDIPIALEAYIEVNILNEESYFHCKITAGYKKTGMVLYDSKVAGTETKLGCGGSVSLTRRVVAVPWGNDLVLRFSVPRAKPKSKCIRLEHDEEECTFKLGTYELQVKIVWTGVLTKHRKNVLKGVGRTLVTNRRMSQQTNRGSRNAIAAPICDVGRRGAEDGCSALPSISRPVPSVDEFLAAFTKPLEPSILSTPALRRTRPRQDASLLPKRSARLAAKSGSRRLKPEDQARCVLLKKMGIEVEAKHEDAVSFDELQTAFTGSLAEESRVAMETFLLRGKKRRIA